MQVVKIKHPSEKEVNPVKEVLFFQKPKTHLDLPTVLPFAKDTARKKVDNIDSDNCLFWGPTFCRFKNT